MFVLSNSNKTSLIFSLTILLFFFHSNSVSQISPQLLYQFNHRADDAIELKANQKKIDELIALLKAELKLKPGSHDLARYLLLSLNFKGRFAVESKADKIKVYQEAIGLGEYYVAKFPASGPIRFELITSVGLDADLKGLMKNALNGVVEKMKFHAEKLILIDSMHYSGAGWKVLGILNYSVPSIPGILSWPDKETALVLLQKALKYFPNDIASNFYYGEALWNKGDKTLAKGFFNRLLSLKIREDYVLEDKDFIVKAKEYLKK